MGKMRPLTLPSPNTWLRSSNGGGAQEVSGRHRVSVLSKPESFLPKLNPLTPMSDQDRLSPYNINTISTR